MSDGNDELSSRTRQSKMDVNICWIIGPEDLQMKGVGAACTATSKVQTKAITKTKLENITVIWLDEKGNDCGGVPKREATPKAENPPKK